MITVSVGAPRFCTVPVPSRVVFEMDASPTSVSVRPSRVMLPTPMVAEPLTVKAPLPVRVPEVQVKAPSIVTPPVPPRVPPARSKVPVASNVEALARFRVPPEMIRVSLLVRLLRLVVPVL